MCGEDNAGIWVIFCGPLCILSLSLAISFFFTFQLPEATSNSSDFLKKILIAQIYTIHFLFFYFLYCTVTNVFTNKLYSISIYINIVESSYLSIRI